MLCDNERMCCQSALDLSTFVVLYVSQDVCRHTNAHTRQHVCASSLWIFRFPHILRMLSILPTSPSLSACCLFIRRAICWNCVFFSARRPLGTLLHVVVLYQLSDARGMPSVGQCPLHGHEVCVFTPGSLSARCRIMGRARGSLQFSTPHHSFGELISFSLWPVIIYSPEYFMAHFRISASLYVQANLYLQQCLCCVISIGPLCSVPCKTIRLVLCAVVVTLIPCCFIV